MTSWENTFLLLGAGGLLKGAVSELNTFFPQTVFVTAQQELAGHVPLLFCNLDMDMFSIPEHCSNQNIVLAEHCQKVPVLSLRLRRSSCRMAAFNMQADRAQ